MEIIQRPTNKYSPGVNFDWYLVLHDTEGTFPNDLSWLLNPAARVSVQYLIAPKGTVYQMVRDNQRAWHAGESSWDGLTGMNAYSIGIEISHISAGSAPYPPAQLRALDELIWALYQKHNFRGPRPIGHREIAPRRKSDPELNLNDYTWAKVWSRLKTQEDDDMFSDKDRAMLVEIKTQLDRSRLSDVARSYDWLMEEARDAGNETEAARLRNKKVSALAELREALGL